MKIKDLPLKSPVDGTERLIVVDASGNAKRVAVSDVREALEEDPTYASIADAIDDPASNLNVVGDDLRTGGKIAGVFAKLTEITGVYGIRTAISSIYANMAALLVIALDLALGVASATIIVAADLALGAPSLIRQAITAAQTAITKAAEAAASAANLGAGAEIFPKLLVKDTATAASFTASAGATVAVSGTNLTLNVASGYAWATVNDTSYDAIDFVDPGTFGRFITIGPWSVDTSKMIVLDLGSSLGAVGNITTAGVYGGMAGVPTGSGNTVTATNDVVRIIKRGTIWSFLIQRGGTGAYVDYIPPIDVSAYTASPRFGFALISGIGSAQAVAGKVTLLKTGYEKVVADVATNTSDIAALKTSTSGLTEIAPLLLSKRALATGDLTLVNAAPTIGGPTNALTITVTNGQRGYAAFPTGSFRQFTIKLTTASQYILIGSNDDGSFVGFSPTDSTYSRYQFTTAGGITSVGALPGNTGRTAAALGDTLRLTLYDGFVYFDIDRGSTGTYASWLKPFRAGDAYANALLGMCATGGTTVVCSGVTVALPGLADLTAQVADNTTNSAKVALGGMQLSRESAFSMTRGPVVDLSNGDVLLGRAPTGDQTIPTVMINPNEQRMEYRIEAGFLGPVIGFNPANGYATVVGTGSVRTVFDVSPTGTLINQAGPGDGSELGILWETDFPTNAWVGDEQAVTIETPEVVRIEVRRAACSFTGGIEPGGEFTASIAPAAGGSAWALMTVTANPSNLALRVGKRIDAFDTVWGTRIIQDNGDGSFRVYPGNQSVSSRKFKTPPTLITTAATTGSIDVGSVLTSGAAANTRVDDALTGDGRVGMFAVSINQTVASGTAMTTAAQTEWSNPMWFNRNAANTAAAVNLLGWDGGLQLGHWLNGQTTSLVVSNLRIGNKKVVTIDGQTRPGLAWDAEDYKVHVRRKNVFKRGRGLLVSHSIGAADGLYGNGFASELMRILELSSLFNLSVSGYTYPQLLARIAASGVEYDIIINQEGVNSYNSTPFTGVSGTPFPQVALGSPTVDAAIYGVASFNGFSMTVASGGPYLASDFILGNGFDLVPYTRVQTVVGGGVYTLDTAQATMTNVPIYAARDFCTSLRKLVEEEHARSPRGAIFNFTENRFNGYTTSGGRAPDDGTRGAVKMIEYIDAALAVSWDLGVESHDAWRGGPFNKFNVRGHKYDGLHDHRKGHLLHAAWLAKKIIGS